MSTISIFLTTLTIILITLIIAIVISPVSVLSVIAPSSKNIKNLAYYKSLDSLYRFYLSLMKVTASELDYEKIDIKPFRKHFSFSKLSIYLYDKDIELLYPRYTSRDQAIPKHSKIFHTPVIRKKSVSEAVSLNDINNPIVHSFVHNKMISFGSENIYYFPISREEHILGVMEVKRDTDKSLLEEDIRQVEFFITIIYMLENWQRQQIINMKMKKDKTQESENTLHSMIKHDEELIRTARLSALGQMARGLAHEIKNPLTTIKLILTGSSEIDTEDINIVKEEVVRLDRLLGQFLSFARPRNYHFVLLNINLTIKEILNLFSKKFEAAKISINTNFSPMLPSIMGDIDSIKQVLINIFENAISVLESMPNAVIDISTKTRLIDGNRMVSVTIHDNGLGIPSDMLESIFEPFFTRKEKGSGLGLAISHNIIAAHKGKIYASNHYRGGASFEILFPVSDEESKKIIRLRDEDINSTLEFLNTIDEIHIYYENLLQYIRNRNTYATVIMKEENKVVGYASAQIMPPEAELLDIAVGKQYRKRGYGRKLIATIEYEMRIKKVKKIFLEVEVENENAITFYSALGYSSSGMRKNYYGQGKDAILMTKDLSDEG